MTKILEAVFDGEVLRLTEPVDIKPNTRVRLTLEVESESEPKSFLQVARGLKLEGPADWSQNLDDYLYGERDNNT